MEGINEDVVFSVEEDGKLVERLWVVRNGILIEFRELPVTDNADSDA